MEEIWYNKFSSVQEVKCISCVYLTVTIFVHDLLVVAAAAFHIVYVIPNSGIASFVVQVILVPSSVILISWLKAKYFEYKGYAHRKLTTTDMKETSQGSLFLMFICHYSFICVPLFTP